MTLTYSPEALPPGGTLVKKHFQDFMKRLRKRCGSQIRYFHCGEYGDEKQRPHYHALVFGMDFPDKILHKRNHEGAPLYISAALDALWGHGQCLIGAVTFESAAYVARYVMKKRTSKDPKDVKRYYELVDQVTGEISDRLPEYVTMSLKPAIGKRWFERFKSDVFPSDQVVLNGRVGGVPDYYDKLLELEDPELLEVLKASRREKADRFFEDQSPARLRVREAVKLAQVRFLKREVE